MNDKGVFVSICDFVKSLFSPSPASTQSAAAANDGLTGVERYIRNQAQKGIQLTGVERYIRSQTTNSKPLTGVEQYVRNQAGAKPLTSVERYIQNKG
ncbi:hypothetical protein [Methylophaga sp. OBS4]|uniref:hypothetical protein n=1 Tax=Methylophaga sp. OBS4 TaxID=2991935 RepID=UPI00224FC61D|nr:hypothetical protein [Methylophaga sp. OBS4]MCX4187333.1 hypothetical protein [Methylophaga sp. OBS4]